MVCMQWSLSEEETPLKPLYWLADMIQKYDALGKPTLKCWMDFIYLQCMVMRVKKSVSMVFKMTDWLYHWQPDSDFLIHTLMVRQCSHSLLLLPTEELCLHSWGLKGKSSHQAENCCSTACYWNSHPTWRHLQFKHITNHKLKHSTGTKLYAASLQSNAEEK